jgi:adenylate kinase family enzyme
MQPPRVNILGASGCGATTAGKALAGSLGVPHFDSDDYYHEPTDPPFQRQSTPQARHDRILADLSPIAGWVLSGGVAGWNPYPPLGFSLIVFLWIPAALRLERLRHREQQRFGPRILAGGDMYATHQEFIEWASHYDAGDVEGKTLARHEAWLATQTCPVLQIRRPAETDEIVRTIRAALAAPQTDRRGTRSAP